MGKNIVAVLVDDEGKHAVRGSRALHFDASVLGLSMLL